MSTTQEQIVAELEKADIPAESIPDYWIRCLAEHRNTGGCGSVDYSTIEFIPLISTLLEKLAKQP
jgi:hypothetical protein